MNQRAITGITNFIFVKDTRKYQKVLRELEKCGKYFLDAYEEITGNSDGIF